MKDNAPVAVPGVFALDEKIDASGSFISSSQFHRIKIHFIYIYY